MKNIPHTSYTFKSLLFIFPFALALFSSQVVLAQPANDLCASAITVTVDIETCTSPTTIGSNVDATDSGEGPICGGGTYSGGDVWYQLTMPAGETTLLVDLISSLPGGALHAELYDLALGGCGGLGAAAYCSSFLNPSGSEIIPGLTGGNTYLLRFFEGQNDVFGTFEFCLRTITPPPANDLCTGAITVPVDIEFCTSPNTIGTNINTSDSGEGPICGGGTYSGGDVWYQFTMPTGETTLLIDLISFIQGGALHAEIYDPSLGGCGSLGAAVYCSSFLSPSGSEIIPGLTGGNTYLLRMFEGQNDAFGTFEFCLKTNPPPPANDLCTGAITVPVDLEFCTSPNTIGSNINTSDSGEGPICGDGAYSGGDVWYQFTMPTGETTLSIDLISLIQGGDLHAEIYDLSLGGCGSLGAAVYCSSFLDGNVDEIIPGLTGGSTYLLRIFEGQNDAFGTFEFCLSAIPPPANDLCTGAITVPVDLEFCTSPNTIGSNINTSDSGEGPICGGGTYSGGDVWYQFTMPTGETTLRIDLISLIQGGDLHAEIYDLSLGGCGSLGAAVYCSSFLQGNVDEMIPGLTGGNTYLLRIFEGQNDAFGTFEFCLRTNPPPPVNDLCSGAIQINVNAGSCSSPTNFAIDLLNLTDSGELPEPSCGSYNGADIWFSMIVPTSGELSIETLDDGSGTYDTVMELYSGTCGALMALSCDDDGSNNTGVFGFSLLELTGLTAGSTVLLRVWEFLGNESGSFDICAWDPAAPTCPDDYADGGMPNSLPALTGMLDINADFETDGSIISDQNIGSVNSAIVVDYNSGTDILLNAGFEVNLEVEFHAFIDGCSLVTSALLDESSTDSSIQDVTDSKKEKKTADEAEN